MEQSSMTRPRDRASASGLLPRMSARPWADGRTFTYRYTTPANQQINLGTNREAAIRKVLDMRGAASDEGTFAQLWRLWQESRQWQRLAPSTQRDYAQAWKQLAKVFADLPAASLQASHVHRYLRVERREMPRANHEVALLSNLCHLAVARGLVEQNVCQGVPLNRTTPRTRLVSTQELAAFADWALQQGASAVVLVSMAQFAALAGSRRCEFLQLHWPQVDHAAGIVRLKRAKQRGRDTREEIALSPALAAVLARMQALEGYHPMGAVFRAPKSGNAYTEQGFKAMWSRLVSQAQKSGIIAERFTFHDLRAHYATHHKAQRGQLPEIHANPATTARIYDRSKVVKRAAI